MDKVKRGHVVAAMLLALLFLVIFLVIGLSTPAASAQPAGQLTAGDREFLVTVRQAGLWAIPAGQQAELHAESQAVKDVGADLAADHMKLDAQVRAVAERLGVALPSQATADQQAWMAELGGKFGADFDKAFANHLRAAHGRVFAVVTQARVDTRNDVIRTFANHVSGIAMRHMTMLESTGLVDFDAPTSTSVVNTALLPATSVPPTTVAATTSTTSGGNDISIGLVLVVCVAEAGLTLGLLRLLRPR